MSHTCPHALPFPPDAVLAALAILFLGEERKAQFCWHADCAYFGVDFGDKVYKVQYDEFDACLDRGWITADGDEVNVTETGKWQARKWLKKHRLEVRKT